METRFRIIAVIGICGVAMLTLLISQYKNLNAQGDITNNSRERFAYQEPLIESEGNKARAYMMDRRANEFYYVGVGEKIGDAIVKDIESNQVTLNRAGDIMTIRAEANPFLSGAGGEDRGDRSLTVKIDRIRIQKIVMASNGI